MDLKYFPKELIILILEYSGKIKYANGKFIDQLDLTDTKYNLVIQNIGQKIIGSQQMTTNYNGSFLMNVSLNNGLYGYMYWHDFNTYMIGFYKNPDNSSANKYKFVDIYYRFLGIYPPNIAISTFEYN
jgi:hypothetical protein